MGEVVLIHIGQAGIQIGNSCWELLCLEHQISQNGQILQKGDNDQKLNSFFTELSTGKLIPRCIFIDLEPTIIDQIKNGEQKELFNDNQLISCNSDGGNNFYKGFYTEGKLILDYCLDQIRKLVENCKQFQGFLIFHALGGGTGSGFTSCLIQSIKQQFAKKIVISFTVYPSPQNSISCLETYNAVFATQYLIEDLDMAIIMDNEAMHNIYRTQLEIQQPSFTNLNRLISQILSYLTISIRFHGIINENLQQLGTNLVPYPRIHFILPSFAPLISSYEDYYEKQEVNEIIAQLFQQTSFLTSCNPEIGKYLSCSMMFKGDVLHNDINAEIYNLKNQKTINFVDWCPTGFKFGINNQQPTIIPGDDLAQTMRAGCMAANSTSIIQMFTRLSKKFDNLYSKRAFIHCYNNEYIEESNFCEARESLEALKMDYYEVGIDTMFGESQFSLLDDDY